MGWFSNAIGAVVSATSAIMGVAKKTSATLVKASKQAWTDFQKNRQRNRMPDAEKQKSDAKDELENVNDELLFILDKYRRTGSNTYRERERASFLQEKKQQLNDIIYGVDDVVVDDIIVTKDISDELTNVNDELLSIVDKYHRTGSVTDKEKERAHFFQEERKRLKDKLDNIDEILVAKDINDESESFEKIYLDDSKAHILQGQVGVSSFGKQCPNCGRTMLVQWPRAAGIAKVADFFWGCPGWYVVKNGQRACSTTILLSDADLNIFTKTDSLEAQVSNEELTSMVLLPDPSNIITERMSDVISDQSSRRIGIESYRCPTHGEKLILRQKKQASGLLDQYFLSCPRWQPHNKGCGYMVKLKSAMQLSTLLKKQTGRGIL